MGLFGEELSQQRNPPLPGSLWGDAGAMGLESRAAEGVRGHGRRGGNSGFHSERGRFCTGCCVLNYTVTGSL